MLGNLCCVNLGDTGTMALAHWSLTPALLSLPALLEAGHPHTPGLSVSPLTRQLFSGNHSRVSVGFTGKRHKNLKALAPAFGSHAHTSDTWNPKPWLLYKLYSEWQCFFFFHELGSFKCRRLNLFHKNVCSHSYALLRILVSWVQTSTCDFATIHMLFW